MPRAHESLNEAYVFRIVGLQVESSLALHYPSPYYFLLVMIIPDLKSAEKQD
jgi:hypothetical protein